MSARRGDVGCAVRLGLRTPCCDRIFRRVEVDRFVCRGCGTMYHNVASIVRNQFGQVLDVTSMTPRRLLRRPVYE